MRTDIEHEMLHQYKLNSVKKDKEVSKFEENLFMKLQTLDKTKKKTLPLPASS